MTSAKEKNLWVEYYRPKCLDQLVHQSRVKKVLKDVVQTSNTTHLLFYGPPGTGKTSAALALCRELFTAEEDPDLFSRRVMQLNASDDRGIKVVREKIKVFAQGAVTTKIMLNTQGTRVPPWKMIILDEADNMTRDAQTALRRTMEDYAASTRFIIICNYLSKIIDPISSRCVRHRFEAIPKAAQLAKLREICSQEGFKAISEEALSQVLDDVQGDMRAAVSLLQNCSALSAGFDMITPEVVDYVAGRPPGSIVEKLLTDALTQPPKSLAAVHTEIIRAGWDVTAILKQLFVAVMKKPVSELSENSKSVIIAHLAEADGRLVKGGSEALQLLDILYVINREATGASQYLQSR